MDLRYKHVEVALAGVCKVTPRDMGAFRARLRHLRNIGLPQLPKPGSGQHIRYGERQALEMLLALEIEKVGHSPRNAALLAQSIVRQSPYGRHGRRDCYIVITEPDRPTYIQAFGRSALTKVLKSAPALVLIINVSVYVRKLQPALERALNAR